jgi:hypothetical protein
MFAALACLLTFTGAPARPLEIVNAQPTYGHLGALRPKGKGALPGDVFHFRFDIKNMKIDANGRASYSLLVEVLDGKGEHLFRYGPHNATAQNCLGGDSMPCTAQLDVPLETPPGAAVLRVTVTDRSDGRKVVFQTKGKVLPADFGLVRVGTFADSLAKTPIAPVGVVGGSLYVHFAAVGFARAKESGQPDLDVSLRVLDEAGKPTMPAPLSGRANADIPSSVKILPMQFGLTLNRPGRFTVELNATDRLSGKTSQVRFPIRVEALE